MIEIRPADTQDAAAIQELLRQLGYDSTVQEVSDRIAGLVGSDHDPVVVATDAGAILGVIALHWTPMLFSALPVARITTLVVSDTTRGRGVGRILVEAGAELARNAGCGTLEVTTALRRSDAQAFYRALGFASSSMRLHRDLLSTLR